ncbi:S53 family peptidase [Paraburkholderia sp. J67]|uniref:S53 family peptidase n=1 Tax=Paraburkholderia sp. J67 TaxID=2805435 RepID=UPI002ABDEBE3|nr:S53 family peptidase [Paraburkholderia sp. J67]
MSSLSSTEASAQVVPSFELVPNELPAPADIDSSSPAASSQLTPAVQELRLTKAVVRAARPGPDASGAVAPAATATAVTTYTPAQIRAAYGLPPLPTSWTGLSATQLAQMGAGQTLYIVDAMSDPNIAAELAAFNQKFGLPACATTAISPSATLPLPKAPSASCQFSVVNSTLAGGMTATAPAYDSAWATEIALDVQWAHATAPLARIVLIQAPGNMSDALLAGVSLANAMGPGVVSMSFGGAEGSWTAQTNSAFAGTGMTYVAAAGDDGASVEWPAVSPNVLAVGGTSLTYNGAARTEAAWSGTGGGISRYTPVPGYQTSAVPGMGTLTARSVSDVSFNANPYTGQYVATLAPGTSTPAWYGVGGTSLSTPQWAGIVAIANAIRAQNGFGFVGLVQPLLYGKISTNASLYKSAFSDITTGSNGTCTTCYAHVGYDQPTGLGTPNATSLLTSILNLSTKQAPVVTPASIQATEGVALAFSVAVSAQDPVTWSLSGAPQGMTIDAAGQLSWPKPVAGSYSVTVKATDTITALSGSTVSTVTVIASSIPVVSIGTIVGTTGKPLSYQVIAQSANPLKFAISGAPAGVSISATGLITWPWPLAGTYSFAVSVTDTKSGKTSTTQARAQISVDPLAPVITASPINGVAGSPLTANVRVSNAAGGPITLYITGAPAGMTLGVGGPGTFVVAWARPVAGSYTLTVTANNSSGLSSQVQIPVTIKAN